MTSSASAETILERLKGECEFSIERLLAKLPSRAADQILRLSSVMPHHAFSRFDDTYLLTTYTFGRGGDNPSMLLRKAVANDPLCEGLTRGFTELWKSKGVRPLGVVGPTASEAAIRLGAREAPQHD